MTRRTPFVWTVAVFVSLYVAAVHSELSNSSSTGDCGYVLAPSLKRAVPLDACMKMEMFVDEWSRFTCDGGGVLYRETFAASPCLDSNVLTREVFGEAFDYHCGLGANCNYTAVFGYSMPCGGEAYDKNDDFDAIVDAAEGHFSFVHSILTDGSTQLYGGNGEEYYQDCVAYYTNTNEPTKAPTDGPTTDFPTTKPTLIPSQMPIVISTQPSLMPSRMPTVVPTDLPSNAPSVQPTRTPSKSPSQTPTAAPTRQPTKLPSDNPSAVPSPAPSPIPTPSPSKSPSGTPSGTPSKSPSRTPSESPTAAPTKVPSDNPSAVPSPAPSPIPTPSPSLMPSRMPSVVPTDLPSSEPSSIPSVSPSLRPTANPSASPTDSPSKAPTSFPSQTPSVSPTGYPSSSPSRVPSLVPSLVPSPAPTKAPNSLDGNNSGCNKLTTEASCLSSRDGRQGQSFTDSPCRWCCGKSCGYGNKCEPESWLLVQSNYIGKSISGLGDGSCTSAPTPMPTKAPNSLDDNNSGCNRLTTETSCLNSKDGRQGQSFTDSPCRWCCGNNCGYGNKCEPESWLLVQPNYIGKSISGLGDGSCTRRRRNLLSVEGECVYELYDECHDQFASSSASPSTSPSSAPSRSPTMSPSAAPSVSATTKRSIAESDGALAADDATVPLATVMLIVAVVGVVCSIVSVGACAYYHRKAKQMHKDVANLVAMELQKTQTQRERDAGYAAPDMEAGNQTTDVVEPDTEAGKKSTAL